MLEPDLTATALLDAGEHVLERWPLGQQLPRHLAAVDACQHEISDKQIDAGRVFGASDRMQPVTEAPAAIRS